MHTNLDLGAIRGDMPSAEYKSQLVRIPVPLFKAIQRLQNLEALKFPEKKRDSFNKVVIAGLVKVAEESDDAEVQKLLNSYLGAEDTYGTYLK